MDISNNDTSGLNIQEKSDNTPLGLSFNNSEESCDDYYRMEEDEINQEEIILQ